MTGWIVNLNEDLLLLNILDEMIEQKKPFRDILIKRCKATLLESHFAMGVLLKFAAYFQNTFSYDHLWWIAFDWGKSFINLK